MMKLSALTKHIALTRSAGFHTRGNKLLAKVLATDGIDELCVKIFQERGHEVDLIKTLPPDELMKVIGKYDGLVVRSATKVNILIKISL